MKNTAYLSFYINLLFILIVFFDIDRNVPYLASCHTKCILCTRYAFGMVSCHYSKSSRPGSPTMSWKSQKVDQIKTDNISDIIIHIFVSMSMHVCLKCLLANAFFHGGKGQQLWRQSVRYKDSEIGPTYLPNSK